MMRVAYFPAGNRDLGSSRLRVYRIADELTSRGVEVAINPPDPTAYDIALVQKRFDLARPMSAWRRAGVCVGWDVDDWLPHGPVEAADFITVTTPQLLTLYPAARLVATCLDVDEDAPRKVHQQPELRRVVWFGGPDNFVHTRHVAEACRLLNLEFIAITDLGSHHIGQLGDARGIQWQVESVDKAIIAADVVVCPYIYAGPYPPEWVNAKTANRLLKAWGLGMPVIGTPIPSYVDAGLRHAASSLAEWIAALEEMRPAAVREADAWYGAGIAEQYHVSKVADDWLAVFEDVLTDN
jgi:hypothetical protein